MLFPFANCQILIDFSTLKLSNFPTYMELTIFSDEHYMREALKEAQKAFDDDEVPVGAVIVCENRIIARAHNLTEKLTDVTAHAEMQAITSAANFLNGKYLNECTLYVTLEPCVMCAGALLNARIGSLVYGAADLKGGATASLYNVSADPRLNHNFPVTHGVLAAESTTLLEQFFASRR